MDSAKTQLVEKLKSANNVLVTVSRNPSVDQLSALLGLTLLLNKLDKHAAAVYSGSTPSTIEFLQPADTIEKTTDSLRDFIIALDKAKADKLRYKVEDDVVRIFITPYKTSITQEDLEFSQGDFNVDVVVALGVYSQEDLDEAITAHGRILHDATVASIVLGPAPGEGGLLGTINWAEPQASSLSELVTDLAQNLGPNLLDAQIATALLTGIVAETARFSNQKTTSQTMSASAALMAAGADQQLVATKLEAGASDSSDDSSGQNQGSDSQGNDDNGGGSGDGDGESPKSDDGTIEINHDDTGADTSDDAPAIELPAPQSEDEGGSPEPSSDEPAPTESEAPGDAGGGMDAGPKLVTEPPTLGGTLTANSQPEGLDPSTDPLGLPSDQPAPLLTRTDEPPAFDPASIMGNPTLTDDATPPPSPAQPLPTETQPPAADTPAPEFVAPSGTLADIEASVQSPHTTPENVDAARDEVSRALNNAAPAAPSPIAALNAQPLGDELHTEDAAQPPAPADTPAADPNAPPPVPPPIPFNFGASNDPPQQ